MASPIVGRVAVGGVLVFVVGLAYYVLFHTDISAKVDREKMRTAEVDKELVVQQQAQASYFSDRDELTLRHQKQKDLNRILPTETDVASFLSALQTVSNISGVDLKGWQPLDEQPQTFFAKVPMRLEMTGRFHQLTKFMFEVGKQERIINMENIELSDPKVDGEDVVMKAKCLATAFHLITPKPEKGAAK